MVEDDFRSIAKMRIIETTEENLGLMIKQAIAENEATSQRLAARYERYKASTIGVPIFSRTFEKTEKINNKINADFFSEIVDVKVGYMTGVPVIYSVEQNSANDTVKEMINSFNSINNISDLDCETVKFMAACGVAYRMLYVGTDEDIAVVKVMNVEPYQVYMKTTQNGKAIDFALRYFDIDVTEAGDDGKPATVKRKYCEVYDSTHIAYFLADKKGDFYLNPLEAVPVAEHGFFEVPIIKFQNNLEELGDCDRVLTLIDAYDKCLSDESSEIEQFRLAYIAFFGGKVTEDGLKLMKQTGAIFVPDGGDVKFITKQIDVALLEHLQKKLEKLIIRFAKSVDFTDENFYGNLTRMAIKFKLMLLDMKCSVTINKMSAALKEQYRIMQSFWAAKGVSYRWRDISPIFTKNVPTNYLEEAETSAKLKGNVSEETRLSLLSFVDNPEAEIEAIKKEAEEVFQSYQLLTQTNTDDSGQTN